MSGYILFLFLNFLQTMIRIGNTLISDDILEQFFICDIEICKGACCVEGDLGAPLEKEELIDLEKNYDKIKPFLSDEGQNAIEKQGLYILDFEGDYSTSTIGGKECAYAIYDDNGCLKCGIEKAYEAGIIDFKKPISCHLYPVRISKNKTNIAVNYDQWHICNSACLLGEKLKVPVYKFLKEALVRKFGEIWYKQLESYAIEKLK